MSAETLPDAGLCRWCPHGQWSHKRGRAGCRELDCGCDKYEPDPDAQRAEKERVLTAVAEVCADQAAKARTELEQLRTTPAPADPAPVDTGHLRKVATGRMLAAKARTVPAREQLAAQLAERTTELEHANARNADLAARVDSLRAELQLVRDARQRALDAYAASVRDGLTAAGRVLYRYNAEQCETCGSRYTTPVGHEHLMTPVTVIVVRRETPGVDRAGQPTTEETP